MEWIKIKIIEIQEYKNKKLHILKYRMMAINDTDVFLLADMPLSSFVHGSFERDASGGIDLAPEQLQHMHLRAWWTT